MSGFRGGDFGGGGDGGSIVPAANGGAYYPAASATLQEAVTAFAASSAATMYLHSSNDYTLTANVTIDGLNNKTIDGNGATITMTGGATIAFDVTNSTGLTIQNLRFVGQGSGFPIGIYMETGTSDNIIENCYFTAFYHAVFLTTARHKLLKSHFYLNFGTSAVRVAGAENLIENNSVRNSTSDGIALVAEYNTVNGNFIRDNGANGISITAGNNGVNNNVIVYNAIGVYVQGAGVGGGNTDHGQINSNFINHNYQANLYVYNLAYSMNIVGNQLWAANGTNLGAGVKASSFGAYLEDVVNLNFSNNTLGTNKFSLAIDGIDDSKIEGNIFIGLSSLTTNHIKEVAGTNQNYSIGGINIIDNQKTGAETMLQAPNASFGDNIGDGALYVSTFGRSYGAAVASAAAIVPSGNIFHVTGTTNITSITSTGIRAGTEIKIIFDGILTFTDGSNLKLNGNFVTTADDTISLIFDGTNWFETARSAN